MFALDKATMEKAVKGWVHEHSTMPTLQWNQIRIPPLPQRFDSAVKVEPAAKARENALSAVGHSVNYALMAGIRMSEPMMAMDELIPDLQIRLSALTSLRPPVYLSPADKSTASQVKEGMEGGQQLFSDPKPGAESQNHWLRSKGPDFLAGSSVLKDIFVRCQ